MMVAAAATACRLPRLRTAIHVLLAFSFAYGLTLGGATVYFKAPVALGLESREAYLARRVGRYDAFSWVNANLPEDAVVMTFDPRSYFIDRPTFQNFEVLESLRPLSVEERMEWFEERNIAYIFYPEAYILESPTYATRGFTSDLEKWRNDPRHFRLLETLELSRPGGTERVEIYRIQYDGMPAAPVSDGDVSP